MITIDKGSDIKLNLTLYAKNANGSRVVVDLSTLTGIAVWLTYQDGTEFLKYSNNATSVEGTNLKKEGFKQLKITGAKQGKFKIVIEADDTKNSKIGYINLNAKIQYPDNDMADKNAVYSCMSNDSFAEIVDSVMSLNTSL